MSDFTYHRPARHPDWRHSNPLYNSTQSSLSSSATTPIYIHSSNAFSTLPTKSGNHSVTQSAHVHNATGPSQGASPCAPNTLIMPFTFDASSYEHTQATTFAPPQVTGFNAFADERPNLRFDFSQTQPLQSGQLDPDFAQIYQHRQQGQLQAQYEPHAQHRQHQRANMDQQHYHQQTQGRTPIQQYRTQRMPVFPNSPDQTLQQVHQRCDSPMSCTSPSLPLTPQQTLKQTPKNPNIRFDSSIGNYPRLQKSPGSGFINTKQQFTQQYCRPATSQSTPATISLPLPQAKPIRRNLTTQPVKPVPVVSRSQNKAAASAHTNTADRNEIAELIRLEKKRKEETERHMRRCEELRKDANAIYYNYKEVLEHFPLHRRERPNAYLTGLLANQTLPAEPTSDRSLAIQYAKKNWQNFWELRDLDYVIDKAKEDIERQMEERSQMADRAAVTPRRHKRKS